MGYERLHRGVPPEIGEAGGGDSQAGAARQCAPGVYQVIRGVLGHVVSLCMDEVFIFSRYGTHMDERCKRVRAQGEWGSRKQDLA